MSQADFNDGEMLEWLKRHAWKACKRQKRFAGSNPVLSAKMKSLAGQKQQGFSVIMNIVKFSKVCSAIVNHKKKLL